MSSNVFLVRTRNCDLRRNHRRTEVGLPDVFLAGAEIIGGGKIAVSKVLETCDQSSTEATKICGRKLTGKTNSGLIFWGGGKLLEECSFSRNGKHRTRFIAARLECVRRMGTSISGFGVTMMRQN